MSAFGGGISFGKGVSADEASALALAAMHKEIGFAVYRDTTHTALAPLVVPANTPTVLPNNGGFKVESQLPSDGTTFYTPSTQRIRGTLFSDIHITSEFLVNSIDANASYINLDFDTGPDGAPNFVGHYQRAIPWGVGVKSPLSIALWGYVGASMIANGAKMWVTTDGAVELSGIALWIRRTHKGIVS